MRNTALLIVGICYMLISCSDVSQVLSREEILKTNPELRTVLEKYKDDSLKYEAACFLIENLPYHSSYSGTELKKYLKYYECISERYNEIGRIKDSLAKADGPFHHSELKKQSDVYTVDAEYLIHNIEWAFKVWEEQPWGKNVSFAVFCNYLLPYRVGDEAPARWREQLYQQYNPILDSVRLLPQAEDPLFVAKVMLDTLVKAPVTFTSKLPEGPHIGPDVVKWRSGTCRDLSDIVTYVLRAVGIPCAIDYMTRGDNNANHSWNVVFAKDESEYMIEFPKILFRPIEQYKSPKSKVYRETFSLNRSDLERMDADLNTVHPIFRIPLFADVTSHYTGDKSRNLMLSQKMLYDKLSAGEILYLCTSRRQEWLPVTWTSLDKKDSICFPAVEGGIVCRLATWRDAKLNLCSDPFLVDKETREVRIFNPGAKLDTVCVFYKFHLYQEAFISRMVDGVFEGSNRHNFSKVDTLYRILQRPERLYNIVHIPGLRDKKYRYVRYKGGEGSYCNVAEIEFYETSSASDPLKGKPIGTPRCWQGDDAHEYTKALDGDPYSSFDYTESASGWVGLDLGSPYSIEKISYVPRNRDNFIRKNDTYELFYWKDKKWNSAGSKQAHADSLLFVVPENSLLYLKNHTRGKDERIFEYKDRKQIFW